MQRDPKSGLSKEFSVAHNLSEQEKRQLEINRLRDEQDRGRVEQMAELAKEKGKIAREETERRKEAIVQRELQKRTAARDEMHLVMKTADQKKPSPRDVERDIRSKVSAQYAPELDSHVKRVEQDLDGPVRKELREATFRDNKPEVTQKPEPAKREPSKDWWKRSAQDMPRERPDAQKQKDRDFWNKPKQEKSQPERSAPKADFWHKKQASQERKPAPEMKRDFNKNGRDPGR